MNTSGHFYGGINYGCQECNNYFDIYDNECKRCKNLFCKKCFNDTTKLKNLSDRELKILQLGINEIEYCKKCILKQLGDKIIYDQCDICEHEFIFDNWNYDTRFVINCKKCKRDICYYCFYVNPKTKKYTKSEIIMMLNLNVKKVCKQCVMEHIAYDNN